MFGNHIFVGGIPYTIEGRIGPGFDSIVYGGHDLSDGKSVAIKVMNFASGFGDYVPKMSTSARAFWKELEMLLFLQDLNPYIIRVFNYDYNNNNGIIVMERGKTLRDTLISYVRMKRPMPPSLVHRFWSQMVEAIYYMHKNRIVHGDCKPENFIQVDPDETTLRLIDMGISFELPPDVTSELHTAAGTPDYVSPEIVNTRKPFVDKTIFGYKADVWALGINLFEMTFGYRPLQALGNNQAKVSFLARLDKDIDIPDHPDKDLRDVLQCCLRSDPRRRPTVKKLLKHRYLKRKH